MTAANPSNDNLICHQSMEINCDEYFVRVVVGMFTDKVTSQLPVRLLTPQLPEGSDQLNCNSDTASYVV